MAELVELDGSYGEGGGQMLRTALGLSAALGRPFVIKEVRAKRKKPGLQAQHLTAVSVMKRLTGAETKGDYLGSTELFFSPSRPASGEVEVDTGTAASATLIVQPLLIASFSGGPVTLRVRGGTDVPLSPTADYVSEVELPILSGFGVSSKFSVLRRGYYPSGGGLVDFSVSRWSPLPIREPIRGKEVRVRGTSRCSSLPPSVASRQAESARRALAEALGVEAEISVEVDREGLGSSITLVAAIGEVLLGSDSLGARGLPAEEVGRGAAARLIEEVKSGASVDSHMADVLVPFLGIAGGEYTIPQLSDHVKSNAYVVEAFLGGEVKAEQETSPTGQKTWRLSYSGMRRRRARPSVHWLVGRLVSRLGVGDPRRRCHRAFKKGFGIAREGRVGSS